MTATRELVLVRHGETTGQSSIRFYGRTDVPLSDLGRRQMARAAAALAWERFDRCVTSPLSRARESAAIMLGPRAIEPRVVPALAEVDFGRWEGLTREEIAARDPQRHAVWLTAGPSFQYPGGEARPALRERVARATREELGGAPGRTLAVLHKGVMKIVLASLLALDHAHLRRLPIDLGSIHRLTWAAGRWTYASRNEIAHLGADHLADG